MNTPSNDDAATHGTPEETSLTVKCMGDTWIVENGLGESVASARDCEGAIQKARQVAPAQRASGISVLNSGGTVQNTLTV